MAIIKAIKKNFFENTLIYKCALILVAFLYILPFTASAAAAVLKVFLFWGAAIVIFDLFTKRVLLQRKFYLCFYAFVLFTGVAALANYSASLVRDIVFTAYLVAAAMIPLLTDKNADREKMKQELYIINSEMIAISFFASLLSLLIFITRYKSSFIAADTEYIFGTFEGRLFGILGNPNSGSLLSFLSIAASFMNIVSINGKQAKKKKSTAAIVFLIINIVLQFIVFFLGNSRSSVVCMMIAVCICLFYIFNDLSVKINKRTLKAVLAFVAAVVIGAGGVFGLWKGSNKVVSYLPSAYDYIAQGIENCKTEPGDESSGTSPHSGDSTLPGDKNDIISEENTDREYLSDDVSNGRISIWKAGLGVVRSHFLFGVGNENILSNANEFMPEELLAVAPAIAANMHNIYLQILVGNGVLAFTAFMAFVVWLILSGIKKLFLAFDNKSVFGKLTLLLFAAVIGVFAENLFDSNLIGFMCFFIVPVFWCYIGYFVYFLESLKPSEKAENTGAAAAATEN